MEIWVPVLVTVLTTLIASSGFWAYMQRRNEGKSATSKLLMGLAYAKITVLGMGYIERGWITRDEFEDFRRYLYDPYKELGGNGVGERIMAEVCNLPLKSHSKYLDIVQAKSRRDTVDVREPKSSAASRQRRV